MACAGAWCFKKYLLTSFYVGFGRYWPVSWAKTSPLEITALWSSVMLSLSASSSWMQVTCRSSTPLAIPHVSMYQSLRSLGDIPFPQYRTCWLFLVAISDVIACKTASALANASLTSSTVLRFRICSGERSVLSPSLRTSTLSPRALQSLERRMYSSWWAEHRISEEDSSFQHTVSSSGRRVVQR